MRWSHVEHATAFFLRHGQWVVFVMRFSPLLRTMISLPAGLSHMKHWKFLVFTFAGAAVWNTLLIYGGKWLAGYFDQMHEVAGALIGGLVALAVLGWLWRVWRWKDEV